MTADLMALLRDEMHAVEIISMDRKAIMLRNQHGLVFRVVAVCNAGDVHLEIRPEPAEPA